MGILTTMRNWAIAIGLFVVAVFSSVLFGRAKQKSKDVATAKANVRKELDKISNVKASVQHEVDKNPPAGPHSDSDQLRNDWSE